MELDIEGVFILFALSELESALIVYFRDSANNATRHINESEEIPGSIHRHSDLLSAQIVPSLDCNASISRNLFTTRSTFQRPEGRSASNEAFGRMLLMIPSQNDVLRRHATC